MMFGLGCARLMGLRVSNAYYAFGCSQSIFPDRGINCDKLLKVSMSDGGEIHVVFMYSRYFSVST